MKRQELIFDKTNNLGNTILEIYKNKRGIEIETYDSARGSAFICEFYELSEEELAKYGDLWKNGNGNCLLYDLAEEYQDEDGDIIPGQSPWKVETNAGTITGKKKLKFWNKQF